MNNSSLEKTSQQLFHFKDQKWPIEEIKPSNYFKKGWLIVPVIHYSKGQTPLAWGLVAESGIVEDFVRQWWPNNNFNKFGIGAILGPKSNLVMVDFDNVKPEIWEKYEQAETLKDRTKRGGHLYWQYDADIPNFEKNGVEFKTWHKENNTQRLAVLPPTIHPSGFERYWANDLPVNKMPVEFKNWLLELAKDEVKKTLNNQNYLKNVITFDDWGLIFNKEIPDHQRNVILTQKIGILFEMFGRTEQAKQFVKLVIHGANLLYCRPSPIPMAEVESLAKSVDKMDERDFLANIGSQKEKETVFRQRFEWQKFLDSGLTYGMGKDIDFEVKPFKIGDFIIFYGKDGVGKTMMALKMLIANSHRYPCIYLGLENDNRSIDEERFNNFMKRKSYYVANYFTGDLHWCYLHNEKLPINQEKYQQYLEEFLAEEKEMFKKIKTDYLKNADPTNIYHKIEYHAQKGFKLFLLDNFTSISFPDKNISETNQIKELLRRLRNLIEKYDITIIGIAHSNRNSNQVVNGIEDDNISGSSNYRRFCDKVFEIKREKSDINLPGKIKGSIFVHKNRAFPSKYGINYFYDITKETMEIVRQENKTDKKMDYKYQKEANVDIKFWNN